MQQRSFFVLLTALLLANVAAGTELIEIRSAKLEQVFAPADSTEERYDSLRAPVSVLLPGVYGSVSNNGLTAGIEVSLLLRPTRNTNYMTGFNAGYFLIGLFPARQSHVIYTFNSYTLGWRSAWRWGQNFFLSVCPAVILGKESRTTYSIPYTSTKYSYSEQKLFTGQFSAGVLMMWPVERQGFFFSGDFFFHGGTGTLLTPAAGVRISVGARL